MRHRVSYRKLGRPSQPRKALLRSLARHFLEQGRIITTEAKAKEVRRMAEKLITRARQDTLHNRRIALSKLPDAKVIRKLFSEIGPKFKERPGGYTRLIKLPPRQGDGAPQALLELVE